MKPTTKVAETVAPDGAVFALYKHDGEFYLYMDERQVTPYPPEVVSCRLTDCVNTKVAGVRYHVRERERVPNTSKSLFPLVLDGQTQELGLKVSQHTRIDRESGF